MTNCAKIGALKTNNTTDDSWSLIISKIRTKRKTIKPTNDILHPLFIKRGKKEKSITAILKKAPYPDTALSSAPKEKSIYPPSIILFIIEKRSLFIYLQSP